MKSSPTPAKGKSRDPVKEQRVAEEVQPSRTLQILRQLRDEPVTDVAADAELFADPALATLSPEEQAVLSAQRRPALYRGLAPGTRR